MFYATPMLLNPCNSHVIELGGPFAVDLLGGLFGFGQTFRVDLLGLGGPFGDLDLCLTPVTPLT